MKKVIFWLAFLVGAQNGFGQNHRTLLDTLQDYFGEIKLAAKAGAPVWNRDLYGPILLVQPDTRQVYANFPDTAGLLKQNGSIYDGYLPMEINLANTSIQWSGRAWAMLILPLPMDKQDRINLLAHELFHVAQPALGFKLFNTTNNHLDQKDGRIFLRLELEALKMAVRANTSMQQKRNLTDALTFRLFRHSSYPGADSTENELELNEGLAEYTGFMLSKRSREQAALHFTQRLIQFLENPTFVRSFAYETLPIYGYLLHTTRKYWNQNVSVKTNLSDYFKKTFHVTMPMDLNKAVARITSRYNGPAIFTEETARETKTLKKIAEYKDKFILQPHLEIYFEQMNVSFDPDNIMPIENKGTVYPNIRVSDAWGILTVTNGALMSPNWDKITISAPTKIEGESVLGDGWSLALRAGYKIFQEPGSIHFKLLKK